MQYNAKSFITFEGLLVKIHSEFKRKFWIKDVSFHVSFHDKFGYMGCCDFSINNP